MNKKRIMMVVIFTFIVMLTTNAQITEMQIQKVDSLVMSWNIPNAPGGVIGIMEKGKLSYIKPFGLASIDYQIPNTDTTIFNIGSVSKQFTAMGIVKLSLEGKLSLDDNVHKYLPELPEFGHKITIRHLLHHISGLRDIHSILTLAGWRSDDPRSNKDLLEIMKRQKDLNFIPGDEYLYSNTNYIFMAMIIEKVTGENFCLWMKEKIFLPLGLTKTYIEDNATKIVKGNATSYSLQEDKSFNRAVEYWNYTGSGNVHTTAIDLLLWLNNFSNPAHGWENAFKLLQTTDTLNNGNYFNYALGIEIDSINGNRRISHGGGVGGFRSFVCTFPSQAVSIVVLTNYSSSNPFFGKLKPVSEIILPQLITNSDQEEKAFDGFIAVTNNNLAKYEGNYWDGNVARRIYLRNDTLWYFRRNGNESPMQYIDNEEFIIMPKAVWKVKFDFEGEKVKSMMVKSRKIQDPYEPFVPVVITNEYLSDFAGKYYRPELDTYYSFSVCNDTLIGYHPRHGTFKTEAQVKKDLFKGKMPFQTINFTRDKNDSIIGMRVTYDRVRNLWFEKEIQK
jgi:CubicO group peptidase (beta-lactamase class C family)